MLKVLRDAKRWSTTGKKVAVASVISTFGSSPRQAGSLMAVDEAGTISGSVSAGCVEGAIVAKALECIETGNDMRLKFSASDEGVGAVGLTCGGEIEIRVQRYDDRVHRAMTELAKQEESRLTLVCVGAVHISLSLAVMARELGYYTIIVEPRGAFSGQERLDDVDEIHTRWPQEAFPVIGIDTNTAVCVLSHDAKIDVPALEEALKTPAFYIGCIGSFKTLRERVGSLREKGVDVRNLARIFGPIGLYIGGNGPEEIALSIMAQIGAVRSGRIAYGREMPGHTLENIPPATPDTNAVAQKATVQKTAAQKAAAQKAAAQKTAIRCSQI
ncbi:MAG: XdhC family protein [Coriobacteriales bacterium]|jgi:xanthine dehydrogenase accessory factor|nr:XdhC family protein [Coriobacteriales bacterium]